MGIKKYCIDIDGTICSNTYGKYDYIGEDVSQIEHMIQAAMIAEEEKQSTDVILACFLHDIGHLLVEDNPNMMGELGVENHETLGRKFLEELGIPEPIPELVENHVKVKRYLVGKNQEYYQKS